MYFNDSQSTDESQSCDSCIFLVPEPRQSRTLSGEQEKNVQACSMSWVSFMLGMHTDGGLLLQTLKELVEGLLDSEVDVDEPLMGAGLDSIGKLFVSR